VPLGILGKGFLSFLGYGHDKTLVPVTTLLHDFHLAGNKHKGT
jgi:hypothetical protein